MKKILFVLIILILLSGCSENKQIENTIISDIPKVETAEIKQESASDYECYSNDDCEDNEECIGNNCKVPVCGPGEKIINHVCKVVEDEELPLVQETDYISQDECYSNDDCEDNEECIGNNCKVPVCASGEYVKNHVCVVMPEEVDTEEPECSINSDCDDNDASTRDVCSTGNCYNTEIVNCINNDGYCPSGCEYIYDNDCVQEGYDVDIDISFSKSSYVIDETVDGTFSIVNNGANFRVYAATNLKKDSGSWICGSTAAATIGSTSWNTGVVDLVSDPEYFSCTGDSFPQAGTYTYRMIIYDCEDIEAELGGDCFSANRADVMSQVNPIDETTETITVS